MLQLPRFVLFLFLLSGVLLPHLSCRKELPPTIIKGQVTDKKTGLPIEDAIIYLGFYYLGKDGNTIIGSKEVRTDIEGKYYLFQSSDYKGIDYSDIRKTGYVSHVLREDIIRAQENVIDVRLSPKDGTLLLEVINQNGQYDSVYVMVGNPTFIHETLGYGILPAKFPIVLSSGEKYSQYFNLPSEEFTSIFWGFSYFPAMKYAPRYDSIYLKLQDTTVFDLSF